MILIGLIALASVAPTSLHGLKADAVAGQSAGSSMKPSWEAVAALAAGTERTQRAVRLLQDASVPVNRAEVEFAFRLGVEAAERLDLDGAVAIQRSLHQRVHEDWSALNLALSLARLEGAEPADAVLAEQLSRSRNPGELWSQRGIFWLGASDDSRARACLGRALALGSADAAVVLAREDLVRGRSTQARAGFRALMLDAAPSPWAQRGFGLALLQ